MQYEPLTNDEFRAAQSNTFEPGRYMLLIVESEAKVSKSGNPMIALTHEVKMGTGKPRRVRDWVMLTGQMAWRLRELAEACRLGDLYASGRMTDADLLGCSLAADITVEESEEYGDSNRVGRYLVQDTVDVPFTSKAQPDIRKPVQAEQDPGDIPEDDIPF